ncbi:MAG: flagellar brake protein [Lachnospiraceae bacterium]|nr:flagellar brake protein [Lachnospiraceae bacterium]
MTEALYKTGDFVELKLMSGRKGNPTGDNQTLSESIIMWAGPDNEIHITMPTMRGQACPVEESEIYELRFIASSGSFACRAQVMEDTDSEFGNGYRLKLISELTKDCKRMFYRLDKVIPIMYSLKEEAGTGQMLEGTCFNLSGGGIRFSSSTDIERGRNILINLMIGKGNTDLIVSGRVIYTDNVGLEDAVYEHRVEFVDMEPDTKERIVRYCFDEACQYS